MTETGKTTIPIPLEKKSRIDKLSDDYLKFIDDLSVEHLNERIKLLSTITHYWKITFLISLGIFLIVGIFTAWANHRYMATFNGQYGFSVWINFFPLWVKIFVSYGLWALGLLLIWLIWTGSRWSHYSREKLYTELRLKEIVQTIEATKLAT